MYKIMPGPEDGRMQGTSATNEIHTTNQPQTPPEALQQDLAQGDQLFNDTDNRRRIPLAQLAESNAAGEERDSFHAPNDNDYLEWKQLSNEQRIDKIRNLSKEPSDTKISGFSEKGIKAMLKLVFSERYYPDSNATQVERDRWDEIKNTIDSLEFFDLELCNGDIANAGACYMADYEDSNGIHKNAIFYGKTSNENSNKEIQQMKDDHGKLPKNLLPYEEYAFLAIMTHEAGHAIQQKVLNMPEGTARSITEVHNVMLHENLFPYRYRKSYFTDEYINATCASGDNFPKRLIDRKKSIDESADKMAKSAINIAQLTTDDHKPLENMLKYTLAFVNDRVSGENEELNAEKRMLFDIITSNPEMDDTDRLNFLEEAYIEIGDRDKVFQSFPDNEQAREDLNALNNCRSKRPGPKLDRKQINISELTSQQNVGVATNLRSEVHNRPRSATLPSKSRPMLH